MPKPVQKRLINLKTTARTTKKRNAMSAQHRLDPADLESGLAAALTFDNQASPDSLTSHCPNPTVAMACS